MQYVNSLLDLIGNTPLVRLARTLDLPRRRADPLVLAKVEYLNPGGSVKDRIATRMIDAAEASGALQPGGTIVEPTSGNTGVGLAMVAQQRGYHCVFVCPDKVSEDKRNVLKAYGAEVVVCPTAVAPEHPDSYYNVSDRLLHAAAAPGSPTSTPTRTTRARTTRPPVPRSGRRPRAGSPTSSPAWAPAARSAASGATSRSRTPTIQVDRRRPGRLGLLRRHRSPLPRRGRRRGLLARDLRPQRRRPGHRGLRRRLLRLHPPAGPRGGACWSAARPAWRRSPRASWPTSSPAPRGRRRGHRGAAARLRPRLPHQGLQRRLAGAVRLPDRPRPTSPDRRRGAARQGRAAARPRAHPPRRDRSPRRCTSCRSTASRRCPWSAPSRRSWPPRWPARSPSGPCSTRCSPARPG